MSESEQSPTTPPAAGEPAGHDHRGEPGTRPLGPRRGSPAPELAPEVSRRVGSILDAVELEAERLREQAREEARRYLDHSRRRADGLVAERQQRIAALSDELMRKAEAVVARLDDAAPVRRGFEHLVRALGDAAERLSAEADEGPAGYEPPPFYAAQPPPPPPLAPAQQLDDTRLVAIQMAAAGSTRAQVREHLRDAIGVADPRAILDEIFGAGAAENARVPWTAFSR